MIAGLLEKPMQKADVVLYFLFRIMVGIMFGMHGLQKLGILGGKMNPDGFMQFIGYAELAGGIALLLGVLSRPAAILSTVIMIGAYLKVHVGMGEWWNPLANKGELALMYVASFLVIMVHGAGKISLEKCLLKKELF